ncbi:MAG: hypothetical protein ACI9P5_004856 [Saprospiraceae bacterium]|jgi:hypothetical protein
MARRRKTENNLLEKILDLTLDIGKILPWWMTLPSAVLLFTLVPFEISTEVNLQQPIDSILFFIGIFFKALFKYLVPLTLLMGAFTSFFDRSKTPGDEIEGLCPECGGNLVKRKGKKGHFIGCSSFPKCRYTADIQ